MNRGTRISSPVSSVASFVTPPLAVSPRTPGSVEVTVNSTCGWKLNANGAAVVFLNLNQHVVDEKLAVVAHGLRSERERVERPLVHEMVPVAVTVEIGGRDHLQVGLPEFLAGLERLVEDGAGQEVPHFQTDEGLSAPGRRF